MSYPLALAAGALSTLVLSGADKVAEAWLLERMPEWLTPCAC